MVLALISAQRTRRFWADRRQVVIHAMPGGGVEGPNLLELAPDCRATRFTPNETPSRKAPCKRQKLLPVPLRRRRAPTTRRRSRFPGVEVQRSLAAALSPPHEAPAAAIQ